MNQSSKRPVTAIDASLEQAIDLKRRETVSEARRDEQLADYLLPRLSLPLRRLRKDRNQDAETVARHEKGFANFEHVVGAYAFPASPEEVALFLLGLIDAGLDMEDLGYYRAAISWKHREAYLADPTASDVVDAVFAHEEVKEKTSEPKKKPRKRGNGTAA